MLHDAYDVIVIGGGGSGLAAAVEAGRAGARVLVLEKAPAIGGSTAQSVGSITTSGSPHQRRAGIVDSPEAHLEDMDLFNAGAAWPDNRPLRAVLTRRSPETLQWLMDLGLEFIGPNPEPPHRVARMHNVVPGSRAYPYYLGRAARRARVQVMCGAALEDLAVEGGAVRGVVARLADGRRHEYRAAHGVILAAGDFGASPELKARFFAGKLAAAESVNPFNSGDGLRVGEAHGATIVNGGFASWHSTRMRFVRPARPKWVTRLPPNRAVARAVGFAWKVVPARMMRPFVMQFITTVLGPETTLFKCGAAMIASDGRDVAVDLTDPERSLAEQGGNNAYILIDKPLAEMFDAWPHFVSTAPGIAYAYFSDYRAARRDIVRKGETLRDLAVALEMDADRLETSVATHNRAIQAGERPGRPIEIAPFFALGPVRNYFASTEGGLAVDEGLRAVDGHGKPIAGLYAAGSNGQGGMILNGHGHHLAWAFVSGRIAAQSAIADASGRPAA